MAINPWIKYGVSGALGVGLLAGAATVTASAMELRTDSGRTIDGGGVDANTLNAPADPTVSPGPHSAVTPATPEAPSVVSAVSAPEPPSQPAPAPPVQVEQPSPVYLDSPVSVASADSVE